MIVLTPSNGRWPLAVAPFFCKGHDLVFRKRVICNTNKIQVKYQADHVLKHFNINIFTAAWQMAAVGYHTLSVQTLLTM